MKTRWIGILGGVLIVLALGANIALPYFWPAQSNPAMNTMMDNGTMMNSATMDHGTMMNSAMMDHQTMMNSAMMDHGTMMNSAMMGGTIGWHTAIVAGFWIGVLLLLTWVGLKLIASQTTPKQATADSPDSLNILQQRFARGELNREEFEQMRGVLTQ
jgi:uncharacterized membrane protein